MGKIKGWAKVRITHQPKSKSKSWIIGVWKSNNSEIIIKKEGVYEYVRKFYGVNQAYLTFNTEKEAYKKAYSYMRSHPNG